MSDRFELEQQILKCWNVTDDIKMLRRAMLDGEKALTTDQIDNALLGIITLYEMRFEETFATFEELVNKKKII